MGSATEVMDSVGVGSSATVVLVKVGPGAGTSVVVEAGVLDSSAGDVVGFVEVDVGAVVSVGSGVVSEVTVSEVEVSEVEVSVMMVSGGSGVAEGAVVIETMFGGTVGG
ncbi:hypothetical protein [Corynebacterium alimapuense]|uniref:Uncharacterized protein n=1 Tax=Corynebacterium alimapuense TaxID=1576874 RepID=A0A3M8K8B3_9CORY|nr:hypothetical protein [Corynebacterium alimapuense]RNE48754.1 hypothetical protein C5L39_05450 [Corynebacterium alimapuense]